MERLSSLVARRPGTYLTILALLATLAGIYLVLRPATLTVGVAPPGGTEPALLREFAEALEREKAGVRLKLVPFPGVKESAEALEAGRIDLAVVRPDVRMPRNGLTLAILRELAAVIVAPGKSVEDVAGLAGKRLAILANRSADPILFSDILGHVGLNLQANAPSPVPDDAVSIVTIDEKDLDAAFRAKRIDAVAIITTPTTPAAQRIVAAVREVDPEGEATMLSLPDVPALVARFPKLQNVTVPAGLFGGDPKLPPEDLTTVGGSHRLMARASLSRSRAAEVTQRLFEMRAGLAATVPAADDIAPPPYDDTAEATTARMPIHPGALDYFEREQEGLLERYESWIYLVAILGGSVVSSFAWIRSRIGQARRERINVATARLLKLRTEAARTTNPERLLRLEEEVDAAAASIARHAAAKPTELRTVEAAAIAAEAARSTVRWAVSRYRAADPGSNSGDRPVVTAPSTRSDA